MVAAAIISYQIFVPPVVGNANNADFGKVAGVFNLGAPAENNDPARFAYLNYVFDPKFHWVSGFWSSESLILMAALAANTVLGKTAGFDMRVMGAVNAAMFLATFWLLTPLLGSLHRAFRVFILALITLIFTDVMYVSYFNSFFMDSAGMMFGLLAVVLFLRSVRYRRAADRWFLVAALALMVASKSQHYPLGIPAAIFLGWKGGLLSPTHGRAYGVTAAAILLAATLFSAKSTPPEYPAYARYNVIFLEIMPNSKNVERDLDALGLASSDARYIGTHAYAANTGMIDPEFVPRFRRQVSYGKIAWYFAKHPADALRTAETRLAEAGRQRSGRGNFDPSAGQPEYAESKSFAVWSDFKSYLFFQHGARYLAYTLLLVAAAVLLAVFQRARLAPGIPEAVCALSAMILLALVVGSLADALDAARQFLLFSTLTDVLLAALVCLGGTAIASMRRAAGNAEAGDAVELSSLNH